MPTSPNAVPLVTLLLCAALVGCGSPAPIAYSGIAASAQLVPNSRDETGRIPYRYATPVDWRRYDRIIIEPVIIYRGADAQFGDMAEADKAILASYMQEQFAEKLGRRFGPGSDTTPGTLRLRLTLTGAVATTPVLAPFTRFDIGGGVINGVQAVRGGEGLFTGTVSYAVEIQDAATGRLVEAQITKQYPNAYNIPATFGSLAAAKAGIEKGAEALAAQMRR